MHFGIALGSNLGDRAENIRRGIEHLLTRVNGIELIAQASTYETAPIDCSTDSPSFLNTVIEVRASCSAGEIHSHLKAIEQILGRPELHERNAPRTLDLDLLYADDIISDDPVLTLPHPRLHLRRFVLQPLADIRPELIVPGQKDSISTLLTQLKDPPEGVRLYAK